MSITDSLKQILPELVQAEDQDLKTLDMDISVATEVLTELNTLMNMRLGVLEPNVVYPWTPTKTP